MISGNRRDSSLIFHECTNKNLHALNDIKMVLPITYEFKTHLHHVPQLPRPLAPSHPERRAEPFGYTLDEANTVPTPHRESRLGKARSRRTLLPCSPSTEFILR